MCKRLESRFLHSSLYTPHSTLNTLGLATPLSPPTAPSPLYRTLHTLHSTFRTLHSTLCTQQPTVQCRITGEEHTRLLYHVVLLGVLGDVHSGSWVLSCSLSFIASFILFTGISMYFILLKILSLLCGICGIFPGSSSQAPTPKWQT